MVLAVVELTTVGPLLLDPDADVVALIVGYLEVALSPGLFVSAGTCVLDK